MGAAFPCVCDRATSPRRRETRLRACVVNNDAAVRFSLKFVLEAAGFEVRGFASGRKLLDSPSIRSADCFVLDHSPRGADGLHLARRLRTHGLSAPIVLTTSLRGGALESFAGAFELVIAAPRFDEALIRRLLHSIEARRQSP